MKLDPAMYLHQYLPLASKEFLWYWSVKSTQLSSVTFNNKFRLANMLSQDRLVLKIRISILNNFVDFQM